MAIGDDQAQNRLSALKAMAAGSPDPYAGPSDTITEAQNAALNKLAGDAAGRAAPQDATTAAEGMVRQPGDNALAGLGQSRSAYSAELEALQNEAANPGAPPSSAGTSSSKGAGYNQYGGYQTGQEYENAVLGRATQMQGERAQQVQTQSEAAQSPVIAQGTNDRLAALKALQAKNEAIVGGPGAVIHGVGWKDNPTPWSPAAAAAAAPPVAVHADPSGQRGVIPAGPVGPVLAPPPAPQEYVGRPGFGYYAPAGNPGTPSASERSNYTPDQVALLRAASDQTYGKAANDQRWLGGMQAGEAQTLGAINDPRNMYEFAQRAAINELGGDPYEAIGRFSPDWAMKNYAIPEVKGPNDYQAAQNDALERSNNQAAGLGAYTDSEVQSRRTQMVRNTPDYASGAAVATAQLNSLAGGPKSDQPVTLDGLRAALAAAGVSPEAAAQVIADYGRDYPGVSYYNDPNAAAAAAAGNASG